MSRFTPCDVKQDDGTYHCPYKDTYGGSEGSMCRDCCGFGADEDSTDYYEDVEESEDEVDPFLQYFTCNCENFVHCAANTDGDTFDPFTCMPCGCEVGGVMVDNFEAKADSELEFKHRLLRICPMCGKTHALLLKDAEWCYTALRQITSIGTSFTFKVQDALPNLNLGEREFVITGYCGECQEMLFGNRLLADSPRYR